MPVDQPAIATSGFRSWVSLSCHCDLWLPLLVPPSVFYEFLCFIGLAVSCKLSSELDDLGMVYIFSRIPDLKIR